MDSWLVPAAQPKVPQKSLAHLDITRSSVKPQLSAALGFAARVKVKYTETARGGLAVNVIEC
jgi:hypothetical protein